MDKMLDEIAGNPVTTSQESGERKPFTMSGRKRALEKKRKRRKVLPGFPWKGQFRTKEEIDAYFAGEKIQCLLCGKWYKQISGTHLTIVHEITGDEYRKRYGLPWKRGLTAEDLYNKRSDISKRFIAEGRIVPFDGKNEQIQQKSSESSQRPPQPFALALKRKAALAVHGRSIPWQRKDYEAILTRMQEQQRTLSDVLKDSDLPGLKSWQRFVKKHPEFTAKLKQIYFSLPYALQLRSGTISPQFQCDCQRLYDQGMSLSRIAKTLGVSKDSVTQVVRKVPAPQWRQADFEAILKRIQEQKRLLTDVCRDADLPNVQNWKGFVKKHPEFAAKLKQVYFSLPYALQLRSRTVSPQFQRDCQDLYDQGISLFRIAKILGVSSRSVRRALIEAGITLETVRKGNLIKQMYQLAKRRGGKCLSKAYINNSTKLLWQCEQGHQWEAIPHNIKQGAWCPHCAGNVKKTIEDMQQLAKRRGGKCLSKAYIDNRTKLLWQCEQGHQWEAKPNNIKTGYWCPYCAGNAKGTLEDMQQLAKDHGGKCLSKEYINTSTKLLWECEQGHQWEAKPDGIKKGGWCPFCARSKRKGTGENKR